MTHLLDNNHHKALVYDQSKNQSNSSNSQTVNNDKTLTVEQLCNHINNTMQLPQLTKSASGKKYTRQMSFHIENNVQPLDYFL